MVANYSSSPFISGSQLGNLDGLLLSQAPNNTEKKGEKKKLNPLQWLRSKILGAQGMTVADDGQVVGLNPNTKGVINTDSLFNSTALGLNFGGSDVGQLYNAAPGTFANSTFTTDSNLFASPVETGSDVAKYFSKEMPYTPSLENVFLKPDGTSAGITGLLTDNSAIANLDPNGDGDGDGDGDDDGDGKDKPKFNLPDMLGMPLDEYMELSAKMANRMANQAAFRASLKDATDALYEGGRTVGEIGSAIGTQSAAAAQALKPADLLTQFKYMPYSSSLGRLMG
jgi:hypothetical protein